MPLSGTFYGTTSNEYIRPKIVWKATQSVSGNYSTVTATLYYSRTNTGYTTKGTGSFSLTINGNKASASKYVTLTYNSNTVAITHKVQVSHAADGTKSVTISATGSISGTTMSSTTISSTVTLDTIPRATTPTLSSSSVNMGSSVTINTPRASSSFTHDLAYKFAGSSWISIRTGVGTSYTWTVPNLATSIKDSASGTMSIRCITKNGSTTIGTKTVSLTVKVPTGTDYGPKINSVTVEEATSGLAAQFDAFIQTKSKLKVVIDAQGYGGSDIKSYSTTFLGSTYKTSTFTTGVVSQSGSLKMVTTVTDSRGRTAKKTTTISVLAYYVPKLLELTAVRGTMGTNGAIVPDPESAKVIISFEYNAPLLQGTPMSKGNQVGYRLAYKKLSDTGWTNLSNVAPGSQVSLNDIVNFTPTLSIDNQWDVLLEITDYFGAKSSAVVTIPSGQPIVDIKENGKGIAFGKVAELDGVDFGWPVHGMANILWDGNVSSTTQGSVMNENQKIFLSERIDEQPTGAVFAWSYYDTANNSTKDYNWHFFFVPKAHVLRVPVNADQAGGVYMPDAYMGLRKYLYINNHTVNDKNETVTTGGTLKTRVLGHLNNDAAGTSNGLAFDNNKYVLRYVLGV